MTCHVMSNFEDEVHISTDPLQNGHKRFDVHVVLSRGGALFTVIA